MKTEYENDWFKVIKDESFFYVSENNASNGAVILVVDDEEQFVFVDIYRTAQKKNLIECPRGYGEFGETSAQAAMRELLEETGYRVSSDSIKKLGSVMPNSAILTSVIDVFLAYVIKEQSSPSLSEVDGLIKVPVDKVSFMVSNGQITDSFTLSALALFWSSPERESFKS